MAFQMEGWLDEMPPALIPGVHAARGFGDQGQALLVLVEKQCEVLRWIAIFGTESVDPLDRLQKHSRVKSVRIVRAGRCALGDADL